MDKKNRWLVKICCVIASFALWLYITNIEQPIKDYKKTIPVQIINEEALTNSKLALIPGQQFSVTINLRGNASDVYTVKADDFKLVADLSAYAVKRGENRIPVTVKEYPENINITSTENLWIKVSLDDYIEKTVPISVEINGKGREGYTTLKPIVTPTDVIIKGCAKYVNQVIRSLVKVDIKNQEKDLNMSLPIQVVDDNGKNISEVSIQPSTVDLSIPIRKTKDVSINVKTTGSVSKDILIKSLTPIPDTLSIVYNTLNAESIKSIDTMPIDLSKIKGEDIIISKLVIPKDISLVNSEEIVKIKPTIDKIGQKTFKLDIQAKNQPKDFNTTFDNQKIEVVVSGQQSLLDNLKNEDLGCTIDLGSINAEGEKNIPVNITLPDGISKISLSPSNVKVTAKAVSKNN